MVNSHRQREFPPRIKKSAFESKRLSKSGFRDNIILWPVCIYLVMTCSQKWRLVEQIKFYFLIIGGDRCEACS